MNNKLKSLIEVLAIVLVFVFIAYIVQVNLSFFECLIQKSLYGILIYIFIIIIAMVVAPISSIPLIPIMSNIWGWKITGFISVVGWTVGSIVVFWLCRRYGVKIIGRLVSLRSIESFERKIPEDRIFYMVLLLRMVIPVDILSYVLGLFSKIRFWPYVVATFIGIIPPAFLLAYLGSINYFYQIIIFLAVGIIFLMVWIVREVVSKNK